MGYGLTLWLLLQGTWMQPCHQSMVRKEIFQHSAVRFVETKYIDDQCQSGFLEFSSEGHFVVVDESMETQKFHFPSDPRLELTLNPALDPPGHFMDFTFHRVTLRPLSKAAVDWMNEQKFCGLANWKKEKSQNVSGKICQFSGGQVRVPAEKEMRYGIFRVEQDFLFLGRLSPEADGSSSEKRPNSWDPIPYQKVFLY